jgi:hypothetical protein
MRTRTLLVAGLLLSALLGTAACSSSSKPASPTTTAATTTTDAAANTTTSGSGTATVPPTGATTSTIPRTPACAASQLKLTHDNQGAAGHIIVTLVFTNTSTTTCAIQGYPGVAALNAAGKQVTQAVRTKNGYAGGVPDDRSIPVVTLNPGQTASAVVEGTDVPSGAQSSCPTYPALLVTPPNTRTSIKVTTSMPGCSPVEVHPVVGGTSGRLS